MARWSIHWGQCLEVFSQMPFNFSRDGLLSFLMCYLCLFPAEASLPATPLLPLEDHASEKFLWPRSSRGPTQGPGIVAISPSPCTFLPPKFYTDLCVLSLRSAPCPWGVYTFSTTCVISGVPGGSRTKHVFESETWLWWWHGWRCPCDWPAPQGREEVPEGATRKE